MEMGVCPKTGRGCNSFHSRLEIDTKWVGYGRMVPKNRRQIRSRLVTYHPVRSRSLCRNVVLAAAGNINGSGKICSDRHNDMNITGPLCMTS